MQLYGPAFLSWEETEQAVGKAKMIHFNPFSAREGELCASLCQGVASSCVESTFLQSPDLLTRKEIILKNLFFQQFIQIFLRDTQINKKIGNVQINGSRLYIFIGGGQGEG